MKQIDKNKLCYYCLGCVKLEDKYFEGIMHCTNFVIGKDMTEYYENLKKVKKQGN